MVKDYLLTHKKLVAWVAISVIVIIVAILVILDILRSTTVSILVTPREATVSINGDNYTNGTYRIFPTERATVTIKAPGFEEKSFELDFPANTTVAIQDYLVNLEEGMSYYESDAEDYAILKLVAKDETALDFIADFEQKLSIKDYLPLVHYGEGIGGGAIEITDASDAENCDRIVCLQVSSNMGEDAAKQVLRDKGFNYDDYLVFYQTYNGV